jgi:hypothetical protein
MKRGNLKKVFISSVFILLGFIFGLGISVFAWVNPSQNPPLGGGVLQTDTSGLKIVTTTQITTGNFTVNNGNVGIGTTNPNNLLQVVDLINFNNTDFNTFLGYQAGKNVVAGAQYNTFIGYQAGFSSSTADSSTADYNTAIGHQALFNNTTGESNTAVGNEALYSNTTGNYNTAIGSNALYSNTTGSFNTAIGYSVLSSNTTGEENTAFGAYALSSNTTGSFNTAIGKEALSLNTTGSLNTAIGYTALYQNTTGDENTALGNNALSYNTTGSFNTAIGNSALSTNTTGSYNTALGYNAGTYIADGTTANTTSTNSIYLGANTKAKFSGATNEIVIGYDAVGAGSNSVVLGNDSITKTILKGNVGIGTTAPTEKLTVEGTISVKGFKMPTGAQSGYVLTSDASGVGTWRPVSIGGLYLLTSFKPTPPEINQYQVPYAIGATAATTFTLSNGTTYWIPFSVSRSVTISQIAINVTTAAAGNHQVGIYASDSLWQPTGSPLISSSFNTGTIGLKTASVSLTLQPGVYWVAWASGSAATVRAISLSSLASLGLPSLGTSNTTMFSTSGSTLPNPAPTSGFTSLSSAVPAVGMIFSF